jgi:serine kinase of HPr protein (carbohydrate metabolism regulator)
VSGAPADFVNIHATALCLGAAGAPFGAPAGAGVLLLGDSGSGKSDVALRLIAAGAQLISDDRTILTRRGDVIYAQAPDTIAGLIEARGVGILRFQPAAPSPVLLAVRLAEGAPQRLPEAAVFRAEGLSDAPAIPLITLPAFEAATPAKIAAAAAAAARKTLFS